MSKLLSIVSLVALPMSPWAAPKLLAATAPSAPANLSAPADAPIPAVLNKVETSAPGRGERPNLVIERSSDGLFYVNATVNDIPVRFVVDSGASVVILSAADAQRAAVGAREGVAVQTAGGASAMRRARIGRVALAGRVLSNVDAAVVGRDLEVSLLGQSALSQLGSVTFKGDRLELD